ncbi:MAG: putative toxin-antitoxin system toxin component, PIN family [Clostridiales Family XIII bacterium]|jgi:putative PIN family toxin of toxin-antitoxin system|nr:putative toxin-antitoxin system toxin component, PIN family [Clostridiales Family XIII bacterium]
MTARIVPDTNILVSALWSKNGTPANIIGLVLAKQLTPCYDYRIMNEYRQVLSRPKFGFSVDDVRDLLEFIKKNGIPVMAKSTGILFTDESDRKFYEVAKECGAVLVTGNLKHFPEEPFIQSAAEFLKGQ